MGKHKKKLKARIKALEATLENAKNPAQAQDVDWHRSEPEPDINAMLEAQNFHRLLSNPSAAMHASNIGRKSLYDAKRTSIDPHRNLKESGYRPALYPFAEAFNYPHSQPLRFRRRSQCQLAVKVLAK